MFDDYAQARNRFVMLKVLKDLGRKKDIELSEVKSEDVVNDSEDQVRGVLISSVSISGTLREKMSGAFLMIVGAFSRIVKLLQ